MRVANPQQPSPGELIYARGYAKRRLLATAKGTVPLADPRFPTGAESLGLQTQDLVSWTRDFVWKGARDAGGWPQASRKP